MATRLPTETELLINERIMGGCNHLEHTTETEREDGFESHYLICMHCGERYYDDDRPYPWEKPRAKSPDYLKKHVPLYAEDLIMARTVVRHLEKKGWKPFLRRKNGKYKYSFTKGQFTVESGLENSEHAAICSAAEELAKQQAR